MFCQFHAASLRKTAALFNQTLQPAKAIGWPDNRACAGREPPVMSFWLRP
jgi:hypothetical protein